MVDGPAQQLAGLAEELDRRRFGGGRSPEHAPSETVELVEVWRLVGERFPERGASETAELVETWRLVGGRRPGRAPLVSGHPTAESHTLAHIFIQHIFS